MPIAQALLLAAAVLAAPARAEDAPAPVEAPAGAPRRDAWRVSVSTGFAGFLQYLSLMEVALDGSSQSSAWEDMYQVGIRVEREVGRMSVGAGYTLEHWRTVLRHGAGPDDATDYTAHVALADARFRWLRRSWLDLYSGGGIGFATLRQTETFGGPPTGETNSYFAFQACGIGVDAGWEHARLFGELGFGFEGVLLAGASVRF